METRKLDLTERVDDAFLLILDVFEATDPFSAVSHGADSGGPVWALESWNEEVPCSRRNAKTKRGRDKEHKSGGSEVRALNKSVTRKRTYRECSIPIPSTATWNLRSILFNACPRDNETGLRVDF